MFTIKDLFFKTNKNLKFFFNIELSLKTALYLVNFFPSRVFVKAKMNSYN
jgi:hypothetical protein